MTDSWRDLLIGRYPRPFLTMIWTGVGTACMTVGLLIAAILLGPTWIWVGGLLLLGVMTIALVAGAYHTYRNAGFGSSLLPTIGVIAGIAVVRRGRTLLDIEQSGQGLQTVDVGILLLTMALIACVIAYGIGLVWE